MDNKSTMSDAQYWQEEYLKWQKDKDIVPVVRCKDCKYFEDCETYCLCTHPEKGWHTKEDNYCESGERKEDEID